MKAPHPLSTTRRWPLLLLAAALPLAATAQTAPPDSAATYQHQLGLTASPVLDGFFKNNRSLPLGLLYKRQMKPNQALRVRVVGQYSRRDTTAHLGPFDGSGIRQWAASGFIGYEWQRPLSKKFGWYYGVELGGGVRRSTRIDIQDVPASDSRGSYTYDARYKTRAWKAQIRPFMGINYSITSNANLFFEASTSSIYEQRKYNFNSYIIRRSGTAGIENYSSQTGSILEFNFQPISLLGFCLKF